MRTIMVLRIPVKAIDCALFRETVRSQTTNTNGADLSDLSTRNDPEHDEAYETIRDSKMYEDGKGSSENHYSSMGIYLFPVSPRTYETLNSYPVTVDTAASTAETGLGPAVLKDEYRHP